MFIELMNTLVSVAYGFVWNLFWTFVVFGVVFALVWVFGFFAVGHSFDAKGSKELDKYLDIDR